MKKFLMAISIAVLFLASCNFDGTKNMNKAGTSSVEVPVYSFMSGILLNQTEAENNEYSVKISFEGNTPKGAVLPEEIKGSTLNDFYGKTFSVKNIPVGEEVQFKILISDKGGELFEGLSKVVKIKSGTQNVAVAMKRAVDYYPVWDCYRPEGGNTILEWYAKNRRNSLDSHEFTPPISDPYNFLDSFVLDKNGNFYNAEAAYENDEFEGFEIYRYSSASGFLKKTVVATIKDINLASWSTPLMYYEYSKDTLYVMPKFDESYAQEEYNAEDAYSLYKIDNVSGITKVEELEEPFVPELSGFSIENFSFYNGKLYVVTEEQQNSFLYSLDLAAKESSGGETPPIRFNITSEIFNGLQMVNNSTEITDLAANEKGVFVLFKETETESDFRSRGGVMKFDHNLDFEKIAGFSNKEYKASFVNGQGVTRNIIQKIPDNITNYFYGPMKIYALKEKELVFVDGGQWIDFKKDGDNNYKHYYESHIVTLNLESMTWIAESVDTRFVEKTTGSSIGFASEAPEGTTGEWN